MGAMFLGVVLTAAPARADFVAGGTSRPGNSSVNGFVDVQVFSTGGIGAGYGTGNPLLEAALAATPGLKKYLYLYETTNNPGSPDISQNSVQTVPANITTPFVPVSIAVAGAFQFFAHPATPATVDAAGTGFAPGGPVSIVASDAGSFVPMVGTTTSSVTASFSGGINLPPQHSVLWGYTSDQAPVIVNTSIQDGGNSAAAGTLGVPEPSSMLLLASGAAGVVGYRLRRRKS
jgi:hypothetical protein